MPITVKTYGTGAATKAPVASKSALQQTATISAPRATYQTQTYGNAPSYTYVNSAGARPSPLKTKAQYPSTGKKNIVETDIVSTKIFQSGQYESVYYEQTSYVNHAPISGGRLTFGSPARQVAYGGTQQTPSFERQYTRAVQTPQSQESYSEEEKVSLFRWDNAANQWVGRDPDSVWREINGDEFVRPLYPTRPQVSAGTDNTDNYLSFSRPDYDLSEGEKRRILQLFEEDSRVYAPKPNSTDFQKFAGTQPYVETSSSGGSRSQSSYYSPEQIAAMFN
ncbi:MAG: hypothetical protein KF874_09690 [Rhizobiaceae bacterium]|nr:hypothetical protein [Rhizobiaceae bacterium]